MERAARAGERCAEETRGTAEPDPPTRLKVDRGTRRVRQREAAAFALDGHTSEAAGPVTAEGAGDTCGS
ncbi:hypothetical protein CcI49_02075 [Frankia sp. CcI49]|nr:hypothetical protein ACG83_09420 [Frankia sp. R43]ONH62206.1 hypothetical protein CcI49_02075 [Frankia sp. CcI49]